MAETIHTITEATLTKGLLYGYDCYICEGVRFDGLDLPRDWSIFEIRDDGTGEPCTLERKVTVNYWGFVLLKTFSIGTMIHKKMLESPNFCLDIKDRIDFGEGEEYTFQWVKENEFSALELLPVVDDDIEEDEDEKSETFEIYYDDLNEDAQKRYLEFMGVSDPKELNMDIPYAFPISIIER